MILFFKRLLSQERKIFVSNISICDVAKHAGVSIATVSHVINNTRSVKEETRNLVLNSIQELNYSPNTAARSFKTGKRNLIAFIVPDISNPFFATLIEEVEMVIAKEALHLLVVNTKETKEREITNLRFLANGGVDGFLLASTFDNYAEMEDVIPKHIPVVLVDRRPAGAPYDSVIVANYQAVYSSVEYLIRKGHTRIGYITGLPRITTTAERLEAYQDAMEANNLSTEGFIRTGTSMSALVSENLDILLAQDCSALIVSNNMMAIQAMMLLDQRGIRVPQDIELIGYMDSAQPQYGTQYMSLIRQPVVDMGRTAGQRLIERLKNPDIPLVVRIGNMHKDFRYGLLESPLLQICRKPHISLHNIKAFIILSLQINHIPVGNSPHPLIGKHSLKFPPFCGINAHQSVVGSF